MGAASIIAIISLALTVLCTGATHLVNRIRANKSGWSGLSAEQKREYVDTIMNQSFSESRTLSTTSAADVFWSYVSQIVTKGSEDTWTEFHEANVWIDSYIKKYEEVYGFSFYYTGETPTAFLDSTWNTVAVLVLVAAAIFFIYKSNRK